METEYVLQNISLKKNIFISKITWCNKSVIYKGHKERNPDWLCFFLKVFVRRVWPRKSPSFWRYWCLTVLNWRIFVGLCSASFRKPKVTSHEPQLTVSYFVWKLVKNEMFFYEKRKTSHDNRLVLSSNGKVRKVANGEQLFSNHE